MRIVKEKKVIWFVVDGKKITAYDVDKKTDINTTTSFLTVTLENGAIRTNKIFETEFDEDKKEILKYLLDFIPNKTVIPDKTIELHTNAKKFLFKVRLTDPFESNNIVISSTKFILDNNEELISYHDKIIGCPVAEAYIKRKEFKYFTTFSFKIFDRILNPDVGHEVIIKYINDIINGEDPAESDWIEIGV